MTPHANRKLKLSFQPLTPNRWPDLERLFGERGACGGCWCMWWRLTRARFNEQKGRKNKAAFKNIVASNQRPGVLGYVNGEPVGWCAVAPRESYQVLERSRVLGRVDDQPVWSVTCLFVAKPYRQAGLSRELLRAAAAHATNCDATVVEGYPVDPRKASMPDAFAWTGLASTFRRAGFKEVARRSATRPIMRLAAARKSA
jgi:GNAT superfamily N-acetyltransferase